MKDYQIKELKARQILDSKGRPVVEVDVLTASGALGRAGASTGTSVGKNESCVLRDGDPSLFGGLSVYKAIRNIEEKIAPALIGKDVRDQLKIDEIMNMLDGTRYKSNLGGNAIYAVSIAAARAAAQLSGLPFYRYMASAEIGTLPLPAFNMVNGGKYRGKTLAFQEFIVIPWNVESIAESVRIGVEVFYKLGDVIKKNQRGRAAAMGNYSGYGAPSEDAFEVFGLIEKAVAELGYTGKVCYAMDCASSEIYSERRNAYLYKREYVDREELISLLAKLASAFPMAFIEDCLQEEDFEGFALAAKKVKTHIIGDDFLCTSIDRACRAIGMKATRGMVVKPNQVGTISEALDSVKFMQEHNMLLVASGRAGGLLDDPVYELGIALGLPLVKTGAPRSGERTNCINRLLRTEEELKEARPYDLRTIPGMSKQLLK